MRTPVLLSLTSLIALLAACPPTRPTIVDPPVEGEGEAGEGEGEEGEGEEGEGEGEGEGDGAFPACVVEGTNAVVFTRDEGATLAATEGTPGANLYTYGLAALGDGNLVAEHGGVFLRSRDHGCTWTELGAAPFTPMRLASGGGRVYAWADNNREFARIDDDDSVHVLALGPPGVWKGLAVADDGAVIAALDATLVKSVDNGESFDRGTSPAFEGDDAGLVYRAFFDPKDVDHVVYGAATAGGRVSFDGGVTWNNSRGLSSTGQQRANLFEGVVSGVDGSVVWAAGVDIEESLADPNAGKHIYLSSDGGRNFAPILSESADVTIINGPMMVPSPTDKDVFYFVFGTFFQGAGTDIYRLVSDGTFTKQHNNYDDITALVFAPDDDQTMYLGVINEQID